MKKKLLTVLLAVVMTFGVFSLAACGEKANPDDTYNYYSAKFTELSAESNVRIHAVTYLGLQRMLTTKGTFLILIDDLSGTAGARLKVVNDVAKNYNTTIYHFNPILSGGNDTTLKGYKSSNLLDTQAALAAISGDVAKMQIDFLAMLNQKVVKNVAEVGANGFPVEGGTRKDVTAYANGAYGDTEDAAMKAALARPDGKTYDAGYKYFTKIPNQKVLAVAGAANTYSVNKTDAKKVDTTYNCSIKSMVDTANVETAIRAVATKVPSYGNNKDETTNKITFAGYDASNISTFNITGDYRLHMAGDDVAKVNGYTEEKSDVYVELANYDMFQTLLTKNNGAFAVFFGGTWCPNTQAIAKLSSDLAKEYGIKKIYMFDPRMDNGVRLDETTVVDSKDADGVVTKVVQVKVDGVNPYGNLNSRSADATDNPNTAVDERISTYNYNFLYANLLKNYLPQYQKAGSQWNVDATLSIGGESFTRMCVPNIMMFDGSVKETVGAKAAKLAKCAEAEYTWGNELHNALWTEALHTVFKTNKYAAYNPVVIAPAPEAPAAGGAAGGGTAGGAGADAGAAC